MKKVKTTSILLLLALTALVAVSVFGFTGCETEKVETAPEYRFEISKYDVTYDISENCSISVTEDLTIKYLGIKSTGFIRDIPANGGVQVRDVNVVRLDNGAEKSVYYDVYNEYSGFLSVDIGDYYNKYGTSETYRLTYTYIITNSVVNKSMLPLNPVGHGWDCTISNASIKLILPDGYKNAVCYKGEAGSTDTYDGFRDDATMNGRTVITAFFERLDKYNGVTFDLNFEKGSISNYSDPTPYLFIIPAVVLLAALVLLKMFVFNKNYLTPVVNYEAPNKMDPLIMGKLIDNKVDKEDVTSLIFYWASKGYIKINLDDKDDPVLIRIMQTLPQPCQPYEQLMFGNIFKKGDVVKISQLKNKFYSTVEQVTNMVNKQSKGLYDSKSVTVSFVFMILSGLLLGLAPFILAFTRISGKMLYLLSFVSIIPAFVIYALAQAVMYNRLKTDKKKLILYCTGIALLCTVFGVAYVVFVPSFIIGTGPKIILITLCNICSAGSVALTMRTKEYTQKLNDIIGFKNFITLAEKDQLEMMLEDDPQFYYHVLPFAQVLGVTDKWEDKFKDITIPPPQWASGNVFTTYLEFRLVNSIIRNSMTSMTSDMVSRPSSSGLNGGGHGGFGGGSFGGHSGGGFGGGGGRGR